MARKIWAVVLAIVAAFVTFTIVEMIGQIVYRAPADFNPEDIEAVKAFIQNLPVGALLIVALGWVAGSFLAGFVEKTVSKTSGLMLPLIVGITLTIAAIVNFATLPHPTWFVILGLLIFIPVTLLGHRAAK